MNMYRKKRKKREKLPYLTLSTVCSKKRKKSSSLKTSTFNHRPTSSNLLYFPPFEPSPKSSSSKEHEELRDKVDLSNARSNQDEKGNQNQEKKGRRKNGWEKNDKDKSSSFLPLSTSTAVFCS